MDFKGKERNMNDNVEKRVALNEKKYRNMVDTTVDSIWVIDASTFEYLYISSDIYELRGYTQDELYGNSVRKSITDESFKNLLELKANAKADYESGVIKSYVAEIEVYHKKGFTIWLEITAKFVKENDEPLKIIGIARNIDKRKKEEQKKDDLNIQLQRTLKEKEALLNEVKRLESLLPICSGCRRIRGPNSSWWPLEKYLENHANSKFSHTICPDCTDIYYPDKKKREES